MVLPPPSLANGVALETLLNKMYCIPKFQMFSTSLSWTLADVQTRRSKCGLLQEQHAGLCVLALEAAFACPLLRPTKINTI